MSLCLWGSDSNGLVITVCLWVYRCMPPSCLHGLWATADKVHTFFLFLPTEDRVSSHCELPLWSYYKAWYFWSTLVWVQGMDLTWLCNLEIHKLPFPTLMWSQELWKEYTQKYLIIEKAQIVQFTPPLCLHSNTTVHLTRSGSTRTAKYLHPL